MGTTAIASIDEFCADLHALLSDCSSGRFSALTANMSKITSEYRMVLNENAILRKLLKEFVDEYLNQCGDCWGGLCDDCDCLVSAFEVDLRKAGIEVEE